MELQSLVSGSDAEVEPAVGDYVERGGFLGDLVSMRFVMLLYGSVLAAFWLVTAVRSNRFAGFDLGPG